MFLSFYIIKFASINVVEEDEENEKQKKNCSDCSNGNYVYCICYHCKKIRRTIIGRHYAGIITILFSYVFSIYIIINGIICMETAVYMRSIFKVNSGIYIVLSGFEVLGGIIMMFISPGLFGTINHYDANGKKVGESRPGFFGGMNNFDVNGKKIGHSSPSFFGGMNYYDNKGQKVGESRPGIFGGVNYYDKKGHKKGHSNPGFFGGFNHYDD